jgi:hypothetical protein
MRCKPRTALEAIPSVAVPVRMGRRSSFAARKKSLTKFGHHAIQILLNAHPGLAKTVLVKRNVEVLQLPIDHTCHQPPYLTR